MEGLVLGKPSIGCRCAPAGSLLRTRKCCRCATKTQLPDVREHRWAPIAGISLHVGVKGRRSRPTSPLARPPPHRTLVTMSLSLVAARHLRTAAPIRAVGAWPCHSGRAHGCARSCGRLRARAEGSRWRGELDVSWIDEDARCGAGGAALHERPLPLEHRIRARRSASRGCSGCGYRTCCCTSRGPPGGGGQPT